MTDQPIKITVNKGASAKIEAPMIEITKPDGTVETRTGKVFICRCGESGNQPFCDGSHKNCGFDR